MDLTRACIYWPNTTGFPRCQSGIEFTTCGLLVDPSSDETDLLTKTLTSTRAKRVIPSRTGRTTLEVALDTA